MEYVVDRVDTMSTVFLGLTLGARDATTTSTIRFTQREYYQLFAYFNNIPELGRYLKYGNTPPLRDSADRIQEATLQCSNESSPQPNRRSDDQHHRNRDRHRHVWEKTLAAGLNWMPDKQLTAQVETAGRLDGKRVVDAGDKGDFGFYDKFSASAWIAPETTNGPIVTKAEDKEDGEGWGLYLVNGQLQVNLIKRKLDDSIRVETKNAIPAGRHHVTMSYNGSRMATGVQHLC